MTANGAIAPAQTHSFNPIRVLSLPWLDRSIATLACIPLVYLAYYRYEHWHHGVPLIAFALNMLILVVTMMIRRPPKRVYAESLVLAVSLRGDLLANCCTRTLAAGPSAGCQLDHRCYRCLEPCHSRLGATQPGTQYRFRACAA